MSTYTIDCTGDVVAGDKIEFSEAVFGGSFKNPKHLGERIVRAEVLRESYGSDKQQHTFTLRILESEGIEALSVGTETRRKGRNIYRNGVNRQIWPDESKRITACDEKHERGTAAREARQERKEEYGWM